MIKSFQDLEVWRKALSLVLAVYKATNTFPRSEQFGVVSQLRRDAYSIPANLAEGYGRRSTKEFLQFLAIANGSAEELRYFLILSKDLRYLSPQDLTAFDREITSIVQMLAGLSRSLKLRAAQSQKSDSSRVTEHGSRDTKMRETARMGIRA
jgi:four helix bundle protein